jgi:hypothetical protein
MKERTQETIRRFTSFWQIRFFYETAKHELSQKHKELEYLFGVDEIIKDREELQSNGQIK